MSDINWARTFPTSDLDALRDQFAGHALAAVAHRYQPENVDDHRCLAYAAYAIADAMLRERAKPKVTTDE